MHGPYGRKLLMTQLHLLRPHRSVMTTTALDIRSTDPGAEAVLQAKGIHSSTEQSMTLAETYRSPVMITPSLLRREMLSPARHHRYLSKTTRNTLTKHCQSLDTALANPWPNLDHTMTKHVWLSESLPIQQNGR